ncbi:MAG: VTT domain-containing protein [Coxiellaceae bacterium]|nr:VTT domain-containing protein [Coxiellaceae bacterium]
MQHFDITHWVATLGYAGLFFIVLLEMGFFFGFFLPGDSLVFAAGLLAAKGIFNIWILVPLLVLTAILGYTVGYWFGDKLGHWLLGRKDSFWFKKKYITQAHSFYEKHGGKALVIGRCVPVVRTFVPVVAGMAEMEYKTYFLFNVIGAVVWGGLITLFGYFVGAAIPDAGRYIVPVILVIIVLSILPGVVHYFKSKST